MYFWLKEKTGSSPIAAMVSTLAYTVIMLCIILFSSLPGETFRYLEF